MRRAEKMKTIRLYDQSPYIKTCQSKVISFQGLTYIFDQSIFFPEKGGQKSDRGFINGVEVLEVKEKQGQLLHYMKSPIDQEQVKMVLDFDFRRDQMQQHCGEHILSGLIKSLYEGHNKGFHIGETYVTLDVDVNLSDEMMLELENKANQVIYDNVPVKLSTLETFEVSNLRKPPSVASDDLNEIRVVSIESVDAVTCCGTHPERTGEVGLIKLFKVEKHRGNYRIYFKCGQRALKDFQFKTSILQEIHLNHNSNDDNVLERLSQEAESLQKLKADYNHINYIYACERAKAQWDDGALAQCFTFEHLEQKVLNDWIKTVDLKQIKFLGVFVKSLNLVVLTCDEASDFSCKAAIEDAKKFSGKGGGTVTRAQGKFETTEEALLFFEGIKKSLNRMK